MIRKFLFSVITCVTFCFCLCPTVRAEPQTDSLQMMIEKLEEELRELKLLIRQQPEMRGKAGAREESVEEKSERDTEKKVKEVETPAVIHRFQFEPYGYIKLDASYDDSRTNYGNFVLYVPEESGGKNDDEFNMTARQTRLGINIAAPHFAGWTTEGRVEVDFYGDGPTRHENKAELMLRHAFLKISQGDLSIIAGQTSDVISPLNPNTLNYTVGWAAGNIGYRRPQLGMTYKHAISNTERLLIGLTIARTSGLANEDVDLDGRNDGEAAGRPSIQARLALASKRFTDKQSVFGLSGHYGKEEIHWDTNEKELESWSVNLDFDIPFTNQISLEGEAFAGCNLDDYFGGVLQGINMSVRDDINAIGGWVQLRYEPHQEWQYHAGFGSDNPSDEDLDPGMRSKNSFVYLNALYNIIPPVTVGLEYSHWETEYKEMSGGTANRIQMSFMYRW